MIKYKIREASTKIGAEKERTIYYPVKASTDRAGLNEIAYLTSERVGLSRGDVLAVLDALGWAMQFYAQRGISMEFPGMGTFSVTLRSKATENAEETGAHQIQGVNLRFRPSVEMKTKLKGCKFSKVNEGGTTSTTTETDPTSSPTDPNTSEEEPDNPLSI